MVQCDVTLAGTVVAGSMWICRCSALSMQLAKLCNPQMGHEVHASLALSQLCSAALLSSAWCCVQVKKLRLLLRARELAAVRVGTVDDFQGQEARIIFISTVLSRPADLPLGGKPPKGSALHPPGGASDPTVGFFRNPNRFNVAITRAQALMVVLGHPLVLMQVRHDTMETCTYMAADFLSFLSPIKEVFDILTMPCHHLEMSMRSDSTTQAHCLRISQLLHLPLTLQTPTVWRRMPWCTPQDVHSAELADQFMQDPNWSELVKYCAARGAYRGAGSESLGILVRNQPSEDSYLPGADQGM